MIVLRYSLKHKRQSTPAELMEEVLTETGNEAVILPHPRSLTGDERKGCKCVRETHLPHFLHLFQFCCRCTIRHGEMYHLGWLPPVAWYGHSYRHACSCCSSYFFGTVVVPIPARPQGRYRCCTKGHFIHVDTNKSSLLCPDPTAAAECETYGEDLLDTI
jgi:hypothetical protein